MRDWLTEFLFEMFKISNAQIPEISFETRKSLINPIQMHVDWVGEQKPEKPARFLIQGILTKSFPARLIATAKLEEPAGVASVTCLEFNRIWVRRVEQIVPLCERTSTPPEFIRPDGTVLINRVDVLWEQIK